MSSAKKKKEVVPSNRDDQAKTKPIPDPCEEIPEISVNDLLERVLSQREDTGNHDSDRKRLKITIEWDEKRQHKRVFRKRLRSKVWGWRIGIPIVFISATTATLIIKHWSGIEGFLFS